MNRLAYARFLIKWISRVELVLVFFMFTPVLGVILYTISPVMVIDGELFFFPYYGDKLLIFSIFIVIGIYLAAMLSDAYFGRKRPKGKEIPTSMTRSLQITLDYLHSLGSPKFYASRVKVVAGDLSMGAHIRGVLRPHLVISGGLLIAFLRRDQRADAIIAHELSHISHLDKFFHAFILLWTVNFIYTIFTIAGRMIIGEKYEHLFVNLAIQFVACSLISGRREIAADIAAATVVGKDAYLSVLTPSNGSHNKISGSYFHPPLAHRRKQVIKSGRITSPSLLIILWMVFTAIMAATRNSEAERIGMLTTAVFGILVEMSRLPIKLLLFDRFNQAKSMSGQQ